MTMISLFSHYRRFSSLLLLLLASPLVAADAPATLEGGWRLDWADEFNGSKLDPKKWQHELGVIRNRDAVQTYTKDCVRVKGGKLILTSKAKTTRNSNYDPRKEHWTHQLKTMPYASGSVTTRDIKHFECPGRLEIRARIPKGKGVWPALWTMHVNQYGWPANGEIDILEHISQEPNTCYSIFRWGANGTNQEHKVIRTTNLPDYSKDFHKYVLEWDEETMRILIDDKEVGRVAMAEANYPDGNNPLRTPCYLIMNTAIDGWAEAPDASQYPVQFEIDYVRYYTKGTPAADAETTDDSAGEKEDKPKKKKKKKSGKKK
jgi:beta-glucanase (GH16 family)